MFWEIISGNIPISNEKGDTSTSVFMLGTILGSSRHLKKEEEEKNPQTFIWEIVQHFISITSIYLEISTCKLLTLIFWQED